MGVEIAFRQMIVLFFGILVGFAAVKAHVLNQDGNKAVSSLVMNAILPFFILSSGMTSSRSVTGTEMLLFFALSLACYAAAFAIGAILTRAPLFPVNERKIYRFMTTFGNTGFIGLPVIGALFGSDAVFYATVFNLPFNFLVFSIGVILVSDSASAKRVEPRTIFNNCFIASIAAIAIYVIGIPIPDLAKSCLDQVGAATVPLAMIITGASLGREPLKDTFASPCLYLITAAKMLLVPFVTFCILSAALQNPLLVKVGTMLMAMPVATNATLLCLQYGGPDRIASRGVFLSTLFSVITIPLFVYLMG